jgi:multiple sugar transport system permease protein
MKKKMKVKPVYIAIFIGLFLLSLFMILPFFWMLSNSLKSTKELLVDPKHLIPVNFTISGYIKVLTKSPFFYWFRNSLFITVTNTLVILLSSTIVGFVFSKFEFKFKKVLFMLVLATMMVPTHTTMIPGFLLINALGLYNTAGALIVPSFVNAFGIFLSKQACDDIPNELIEAARMEGASNWSIYLKIVLPLLKPTVGALTIFTFLNYWNDYLNPLIMINDIKKMTLPLALSYFSSQHTADLSATMAASALIMMPVIIVFLMFQKQFIKGIATTGMK